MPGPYITDAGLTIPTVESLKQDAVAAQRSLIDPLLDTDAEEALGQLNGIVASALREAYEVIEYVNNGIDPDAAENAQVDVLCSLTGSRRAPATKSTFSGTRKLDVDLDAGATLPLGTFFEVDGNPLVKFTTTEIVTAVGAGSYKVAAEAENAGRVVCTAGTLTVITTPVVGLNSVNNAFDAIVGTNVDTDEEALVRRENELDTLGSSTPAAIRGHLLEYEIDGDHPILEVTVFENDGDTVDSIGLPPHSMEALVFDGLAADAEDDAIAQVIFDHKPGGTQMFGSESGTAVDANGNEHTVNFSRPTQVGIEVEVTVEIDPETYAGEQAVYDAWSAFVNAVPQGSEEVKFSQGIKALLAVAGVLGIETMKMRRTGGSYDAPLTDLALAIREKPFADADSSYVVIVVA